MKVDISPFMTDYWLDKVTKAQEGLDQVTEQIHREIVEYRIGRENSIRRWIPFMKPLNPENFTLQDTEDFETLGDKYLFTNNRLQDERRALRRIWSALYDLSKERVSTVTLNEEEVKLIWRYA